MQRGRKCREIVKCREVVSAMKIDWFRLREGLAVDERDVDCGVRTW